MIEINGRWLRSTKVGIASSERCIRKVVDSRLFDRTFSHNLSSFESVVEIPVEESRSAWPIDVL